MQVTNVRVSFLREKQPAQYEKAAPAVEFSAVLDAGDDHRLAARSLMIDATAIVYAGIGYEVPERVAAALASGKVPAEVAVETEAVKVADRAPLTAEKAAAGDNGTAEEAPEKPTPKKRGRPKGSTNTRPKAGSKAAEKAAKATKKAAPTKAADVPDDDIPGDAPRVGPKDDPKDHGIEEEGPRRDFTAKDLHTMIIDLINEKKLSVPSAKQLLAHFKVARAQDLTADQVAEGKVMIEKMVATVK